MDHKVMVCFADIGEEFDEYKLLSQKEIIHLLNQKIKKDPIVTAFIDSQKEDDKKRCFPEYRIDKKTGHMHLWMSPALIETFPYECETVGDYIKHLYGTFKEIKV